MAPGLARVGSGRWRIDTQCTLPADFDAMSSFTASRMRSHTACPSMSPAWQFAYSDGQGTTLAWSPCPSTLRMRPSLCGQRSLLLNQASRGSGSRDTQRSDRGQEFCLCEIRLAHPRELRSTTHFLSSGSPWWCRRVAMGSLICKFPGQKCDVIHTDLWCIGAINSPRARLALPMRRQGRRTERLIWETLDGRKNLMRRRKPRGA